VNAVSSARTLTGHTAVVKNNGLNPIWRESFSLPFDCVGNMKELIFVEFAVRHQNGALLGMYCTQLTCMGQGSSEVMTIQFGS
jgi:phosphatidylinositol phospholipase C delta